MAAKIYSAPEEIGDAPAWNTGMDFRDHMKAEQEWEQKVIDWCKENGTGEYAGEVYRWQIADGYASYVVYKMRPLTLIWLNTGDAWSLPAAVARGLTAADVKQHVEFNRRWKAATAS